MPRPSSAPVKNKLMRNAGARIAEALKQRWRNPECRESSPSRARATTAATPSPRLPSSRRSTNVRSRQTRRGSGSPARDAARDSREKGRSHESCRCRRTSAKRARCSRTPSASTACSEPARGCRSRRSTGIRRARSTRASGAVLAIDIPSGIDARTGAVRDDAVRASVTVTLAAAKPGLLLEPAREYVGELSSARRSASTTPSSPHSRATFAALDDAEFMRLLAAARDPTREKRAAGAPLIVAGSAQFPGAAVLCARAAARAGAGYVTVATPRRRPATLRAHLVEQVVVGVARSRAARRRREGTARNCRSATAPSRSVPVWDWTIAPARSSRFSSRARPCRSSSTRAVSFI